MGKMITAAVDEATSSRIQELARQEKRLPEQVAAAALRLYLRLPEETQAAFRALEKTGSEEDLQAFTRSMAFAALSPGWEAAHRKLMETMSPVPFETEEELLDEGVRLTRKQAS